MDYKQLCYTVYALSESDRYKRAKIPKKKPGEHRLLFIPNPDLKFIQRRLSEILSDCEEIILQPKVKAGDHPLRKRSLSHGFRRQHTIHTNAFIHTGQRYVLNFDLEDFFPSIRFGRVVGYFKKNNNFQLEHEVAVTIAQIACVEGRLPQGSPCSPVIANLIASILDVRLARFAGKNGCRYSRYADDITISTGRKTFPSAIASITDGDPRTVILSKAIRKRIDRAGFRLNDAKTRLLPRTTRQVVTGLTVNRKVNVTSTYYRTARAVCHRLFTQGTCSFPGAMTPMHAPDSEEEVRDPLERINGILQFVYWTREQNDERPPKTKKHQKRSDRQLYEDFLFFRHFVAHEAPVFICEGPTDPIYLKSALIGLESVGVHFPSMAGAQFLGDGPVKRALLGLEGGEGDLRILGKDYEKRFLRGNVGRGRTPPFNHEKYPAWKPKFPVFMLFDSDSAGVGAINAILHSGKGPSKVEVDSTTVTWPAERNLHLAKIPSVKGAAGTVIEDLFDAATLNFKLDGRSFTKAENYDPKKHYGKMDFALRVVRERALKIDFSEFEALFEAFDKVIQSYPGKGQRA